MTRAGAFTLHLLPAFRGGEIGPPERPGPALEGTGFVDRAPARLAVEEHAVTICILSQREFAESLARASVELRRCSCSGGRRWPEVPLPKPRPPPEHLCNSCRIAYIGTSTRRRTTAGRAMIRLWIQSSCVSSDSNSLSYNTKHHE